MSKSEEQDMNLHPHASHLSNFGHPSNDLSLDEEREVLRRETEKQALAQLEKARVSFNNLVIEAERVLRFM